MNALLGRWAKTIQVWGFSKLVRAVELVAILVAIVAFFNELNYRHEERTARAWQLLTTPAPGNSGKEAALVYLHGRNISLAGIDLTPPIVAERWKQRPKRSRQPVKDCPQFTYLRKVKIPKAILTNATLVCTDLQGADLRGADLREADLRGADLSGANLTKADLSGADLQDGVKLKNADLRGANLSGTWMREANLENADLRGANLEKARMREANLENTDLRGANLSRAKMSEAYLENTDLQGANLEKADLRQMDRIQCSDLTQASSWEAAYRDENLACGRPIPSPRSRR